MKIVVLDGYTLNPGDLSWKELEQFGRVEIFDRTPAEDVIRRAAGAEILLTNKTVLDAAAIAKLPLLRYIGVLATGYNVVDIGAARARGIIVSNVPAYGIDSVAQMCFAHILNLTNRVADHAASVERGDWCEAEDFCYWQYPLMELAGKTMSIIGYGALGQAVARLALAFGMQVLIHTRTVPGRLPEGVTHVDLDRAFAEADILSLHCPLTEKTAGMVDATRLSLMKPTALLINTSRGPLLDEAAVAAALNADRLGGAGLDVLSEEPPVRSNPLFRAKNCFITPHIAWATREARNRLFIIAAENIRAFLQGSPCNVVN
ncbi:MAG: D-2-hydroxyacid dehydrogenase [Desulfocapsaceae bacterium]|nr:D-2-hydroxyacid dehydrogenase [Desulfocapsaceae bacterium]